MPPLDPETPVRALDGLVVRRVGGQVFVLLPDSSMHGFNNESAVAIWDQLVTAGSAGLSARALSQRLSAEFSVEPDQALETVLPFLERLIAEGLCAPAGA